MMNYFKPSSTVAIQLDNNQFWLQIDKILMENNVVIIPVPHFFSVNQIIHMTNSAGIGTVICNRKAQTLWTNLGFEEPFYLTKDIVIMTRKLKPQIRFPKKTHKVTFTSGTTGEPKGVCLSEEHLRKVGQSLAEVTSKFNVKKHLCVLPLSILLENVAANYAAEYAGIEVITVPMSELGMNGSGSLDIEKFINALVQYQAQSIIVMPQMLKMMIAYLQQNQTDVSFLRFIAVGGAVCSKGLLEQAKELGLPVYEGYGISECGSVISLNTDDSETGHVGKILPHINVRIAEDGEIQTQGASYLGYLGEEKNSDEWFSTGDIGRFDEHHNLHIIGRKKNVIINSFGRNISPDWIEAELTAIPGIMQAVVYGDSEPFLTAICVTTHSLQSLQERIEQFNQNFPDYAQIKQIILADEPFSISNNMLTSSGKSKHQQIFKTYTKQLQDIYAVTTETRNYAV
ncbi:MAG TPA: AMP-binding protein [Gammaproteobacteria bacterium]|nr:AMP-binding protein [Xanthomonadales bacterium]MCB1594196.1 AMP-binding protein [Xanthomonadales bacterium]HOP22506.1 AMP-binding protein [Gammaproteobacteria bacterium]HPI96158.1 AMP-binding protein [Gammaproteobacteria bacterium]HPQ87612.1 AMP-binding protein [Gammaproteobacteria bacterium]